MNDVWFYVHLVYVALSGPYEEQRQGKRQEKNKLPKLIRVTPLITSKILMTVICHVTGYTENTSKAIDRFSGRGNNVIFYTKFALATNALRSD